MPSCCCRGILLYQQGGVQEPGNHQWCVRHFWGRHHDFFCILSCPGCWMALATPGAPTLCIVLTVNCLYHSYNVPTIHVPLCFVDCSSTWLIHFLSHFVSQTCVRPARPVSDLPSLVSDLSHLVCQTHGLHQQKQSPRPSVGITLGSNLVSLKCCMKWRFERLELK